MDFLGAMPRGLQHFDHVRLCRQMKEVIVMSGIPHVSVVQINIGPTKRGGRGQARAPSALTARST